MKNHKRIGFFAVFVTGRGSRGWKIIAIINNTTVRLPMNIVYPLNIK